MAIGRDGGLSNCVIAAPNYNNKLWFGAERLTVNEQLPLFR